MECGNDLVPSLEEKLSPFEPRPQGFSEFWPHPPRKGLSSIASGSPLSSSPLVCPSWPAVPRPRRPSSSSTPSRAHRERGEYFSHSTPFSILSSPHNSSRWPARSTGAGWSAIDNEDPYLQESLSEQDHRVPGDREDHFLPSQWYPLPSEGLR